MSSAVGTGDVQSAVGGPLVYRADIDGLRGLAVIAVVWFHSDLPGLPGGFTGVDVFFVISGYLITAIIDREVHAGQFSFAHFYERRVRRIAPALLLVTAASLFAGLILLLPFELEQMAQSAIATVAMGSNIFFWRHGDYFALTESIVPLLHTWSLGVEEQFYLLFPVTLIIAERWKRPRAAIAAIALGSFLICLFASYQWPVAGFYLLPARGWELMVGAALAVRLLTINDRIKPIAGLVGIALIAVAAAIFTETDAFPGWRALLPTAGAALLIGGGPDGPAQRALASRPLVYVGKVSYSFYLWHWPVFVFLRHWTAAVTLPSALSVLGILLALLLSAASYHWLEKPARDRRTPFRTVLLPSILSAVIIVGAAAVAVGGKGLPGRLSTRVVAIAAEHDAFAPLAHSCSDVDVDYAIKHCRLGPAGRPRFLLWGDSRAAAISEAVETALQRPGLVISNGACPPTMGWITPTFRGREKAICRSANARALSMTESNPAIDTVVLEAYWPAYSRRGGVAFWSSTQGLVDRLNGTGKRVIVVAGEPDAGVDVPWASAIRAEFGREPLVLDCPKPQVPLKRVTLIDVSAAFCRGIPYRLLTDSNHPSRYAGLTIIAPALRAALAGEQ